MITNYESCIKACQECFIECQNCLVQMAGKESMNDCPLCCIQCIEACLVAIKFMIADSKFTPEYCRLCALICEWCAEQCNQHEHEHCKICAASCLACAKECRKHAA